MANTYIYKTPGSEGNRQIFTLSMWFKLAIPSGTRYLFHAGTSNSNTDRFQVWLNDDGQLSIQGSSYYYVTNRRLADTSAWYHLVIACNSTLTTANDRMKIYINGELLDPTKQATYNAKTEDENFGVGTSTRHDYGAYNNMSNSYSHYFDGSMAYISYVDGTQCAATVFGETDSTTGIWKWKSPSPTWGSQGWYLKFETGTSDANLVVDSSGNTNTFTIGGGTLRQSTDNPSNNFTVLDGADTYSTGSTISGGGFKIATGGSQFGILTSSLGVNKGKWYCEMKQLNSGDENALYGVTARTERETNKYLGQYNESVGYYSGSGYYKNNSITNEAAFSSYGQNDVIGIALDCDNSALYFSKNGTWLNSGDPTSGASKTGAIGIVTLGWGATQKWDERWFFAIGDYGSSGSLSAAVNFGQGFFDTTYANSNADDAGQGKFQYDVPAGYYALCTKNLATYG